MTKSGARFHKSEKNTELIIAKEDVSLGAKNSTGTTLTSHQVSHLLFPRVLCPLLPLPNPSEELIHE